MRLALLVSLLLPLVMAGCARVYYEGQPAHFMSFEEEVRRISEGAPCEWTHGKNDPQSVVKYDFGCHGGKWGTASLYLDRKETEKNQVKRLRFLWREWKEGQHIVSERQVAEKFTDFLVHAYAPDMKNLLKGTFFDTQRRQFDTTRLSFEYSAVVTSRYTLHRLEVRERVPVNISP